MYTIVDYMDVTRYTGQSYYSRSVKLDYSTSAKAYYKNIIENILTNMDNYQHGKYFSSRVGIVSRVIKNKASTQKQLFDVFSDVVLYFCKHTGNYFVYTPQGSLYRMQAGDSFQPDTGNAPAFSLGPNRTISCYGGYGRQPIARELL